MTRDCKTCKYGSGPTNPQACQGCWRAPGGNTKWVPKCLRRTAARVCQSGAWNPIPISKALHDAILEVHQEQGDPAKDAAVYLILHQLTYLLTGVDIAEPGRYTKSMMEIES